MPTWIQIFRLEENHFIWFTQWFPRDNVPYFQILITHVVSFMPPCLRSVRELRPTQCSWGCYGNIERFFACQDGGQTWLKVQCVSWTFTSIYVLVYIHGEAHAPQHKQVKVHLQEAINLNKYFVIANNVLESSVSESFVSANNWSCSCQLPFFLAS